MGVAQLNANSHLDKVMQNSVKKIQTLHPEITEPDSIERDSEYLSENKRGETRFSFSYLLVT